MSNPYDNAPDKKISILGPTLVFKGELSAEEDLLIQGKVQGSIEHTASLTVGKEGSIKANTRAKYITVEGAVDGDLYGTKAVLIRESADVRGNIVAPTVSLVEGAKFNGKIDMDVDPATVAPKPKVDEQPTEVAEKSGATASPRRNKTRATTAKTG